MRKEVPIFLASTAAIGLFAEWTSGPNSLGGLGPYIAAFGILGSIASGA